MFSWMWYPGIQLLIFMYWSEMRCHFWCDHCLPMWTWLWSRKDILCALQWGDHLLKNWFDERCVDVFCWYNSLFVIYLIYYLFISRLRFIHENKKVMYRIILQNLLCVWNTFVLFKSWFKGIEFKHAYN